MTKGLTKRRKIDIFLAGIGGQGVLLASEIISQAGLSAGYDVKKSVDILRILKRAKINVEYTYAFVERGAERAILIFRFDDVEKGIQALQAEGVTLLGAEEVRSR